MVVNLVASRGVANRADHRKGFWFHCDGKWEADFFSKQQLKRLFRTQSAFAECKRTILVMIINFLGSFSDFSCNSTLTCRVDAVVAANMDKCLSNSVPDKETFEFLCAAVRNGSESG